MLRDHHRVGREQQREDDGVAHQVEPEAERPLLVHVRRRRFIGVRPPAVTNASAVMSGFPAAAAGKAPAARRLRAGGARQRLVSPGLDLLHLAGGQAILGVVVGSARDDHAPTCRRPTAMASHQMCQTMAKPSTKPARTPRITPALRVRRHVDVVIAVGPAIGDAARLHLVEGVDVAHLRQHREIVGRRRRSGQPFQGAAVPRIAAEIERLLSRRGC